MSATDNREWKDYDIKEVTNNDEVLAYLTESVIKTAGEAWLLVCSQKIDNEVVCDKLRDDFEVFFKSHPESEFREYQPADGRLAELERKAKLLRNIQSCNQRTFELEAVWSNAKAEAKEAKDAWELGVLKLQALIESAHNGQRLLPGMDEEATQDAPGMAQNADVQKDATDNQNASDEAWRNVTLESIGVKGKLLERLVEADLGTLGEWSEWHGQGQNRPKVAGIGEGAISKVADLCEAFWKLAAGADGA